MRRKVTCLLLAVGSLLAAPRLEAGGLVAAKYAGEFLSLGVGARALGMGGAYAAIADDITASYWNPAGLVNLNYPQIFFMHAERFGGAVNHDYGAVALPFGSKSSIGLSVYRIGVDDIPITALQDPTRELSPSNRVIPVKWISDAEWVLFLTYAKRVQRDLLIGGNVKLLNKTIGDNSAYGIGFDLGVLFNPWTNLRVGVNLRDFTSTLVAWDTGRRELIRPTLRTGLAYPIELPSLKLRITPGVDFDTQFEGRRFASQGHLGDMSFESHYGLDVTFKNLLAFRLGSDVNRFTVGTGFHLPKLNIDYAFVGHSDLGDTHRLSLLLTLEEEKFIRKTEPR